MIHVLQFALVIFFSLCLTIYLGKKLNLGSSLSTIIYSVHTSYCIIYWYLYVYVGYSDAVMYFNLSLIQDFNWLPGNKFIISLTKIWSDILGLNILNTFLVFNMFGVIGVQFLLRVLLDIWPKSGKLIHMPYYIILLPGQSFWSSAIGKDGISYLSISIILYGLYATKYRYLIAGILMMFLIRPHIALVMVLTTIIVFLFSSFQNILSKYVILLFALISVYFGLGFVLDFLSIKSFSVANIFDFIAIREKLLMGGGSSYSVENMLFIQRVGGFLFAPFFFNVKNITGFIFAIENLFIFIFAIKYILFQMPFFLKNFRLPIISYSLVYSTVTIVIMSLTTSNVGIALRQKYMILPFLFVLGAMAVKSHYIKSESRKKLAYK